MAADRSSFHVERAVEGSRTVLRVKGIIDENADVSFFRELRGAVAIQLRELRRINSFGVRLWMNGIESVPEGVSIDLYDCPPPFVDQLNMLKGFIGRARVRSFLATYLCEACDLETDESIDVDECRRDGCRLPAEKTCPSCSSVMEINQLESMYLRFLRNPQ